MDQGGENLESSIVRKVKNNRKSADRDSTLDSAAKQFEELARQIGKDRAFKIIQDKI
jgi:hypothetical protein